jgi:DHA1 family tetracycline resistance protein-like MFS transporter
MTAISSDPAQKRSAAAFPVLLMVMFINILGFGVVVPLLPFYGQSFHAPAWGIALVFSAYALGAFFGEPFWGRLSDQVGRRPILISTICGNCLCYLGLAFAPNVFVAFLVRLAGGLAAGNGSVIQGYIADVSPLESRTGRIGWLGAAFNVGLIIGPSLGGLFARPQMGPAGFRIPLLIAAGLSAVAVTGVVLFVGESRVRTQAASVRPNRWAILGEVARHPVLGRLMLLTFVVGFAFTGIESTFGLWAQHRFGWGPRNVGVCFAFVGAASALCQSMLTGRLSRRYGEAAMLIVGMAITFACAAIQPLTDGGWTTVAVMTVMAVGQSVAFPNVAALLSRTADQDSQGQILGLNNAAGAMARVAGPFCAGLAFASFSVDAPFLLGAAVVAPAIFLARSAGQAVMRHRAHA